MQNYIISMCKTTLYFDKAGVPENYQAKYFC